MSKKRVGLGWVPDLPDIRDRYYDTQPRPGLALPSTISLRDLCSPVEDQGRLMSCTAAALAGALEFLEKKDRKPFVNVSKLFIYYTARAITSDVPIDDGVEIRDGIKALVRYGVCSEKSWPYRTADCDRKPPERCYDQAKEHPITSYRRITQQIDKLRTCLAEGFPFVFGFTMYEPSWTASRRTGRLPMPQDTEVPAGGHAVLCVGYDDTASQFLIRNSLGKDWGEGGYGWMSYSYVEDANLCEDFWTIRR